MVVERMHIVTNMKQSNIFEDFWLDEYFGGLSYDGTLKFSNWSYGGRLSSIEIDACSALLRRK